MHVSGHSQQGHSSCLRAHPAPGPEPRDGQSHVRALHQGQRHRDERDAQIQEEVCHDHTLQTYLGRVTPQ